ncbi:hypothetical protein PFISCL1PPCAC_4409, partial [Pristionchus fissidentatus]
AAAAATGNSAVAVARAYGEEMRERVQRKIDLEALYPCSIDGRSLMLPRQQLLQPFTIAGEPLLDLPPAPRPKIMCLYCTCWRRLGAEMAQHVRDRHPTQPVEKWEEKAMEWNGYEETADNDGDSISISRSVLLAAPRPKHSTPEERSWLQEEMQSLKKRLHSDDNKTERVRRKRKKRKMVDECDSEEYEMYNADDCEWTMKSKKEK